MLINSELFLDELVELLKKDDAPQIEVVERWVSYTGSSSSADATKVHAIIHEFQEKALSDSTNPAVSKSCSSQNRGKLLIDGKYW